MSTFLTIYWQKRVWNSVRAYYLTLPNSSDEGWIKISSNPLSFNLIWRSALNRVVLPRLELNSNPPPAHYRHITRFSSGLDLSRDQEKPVING